MWRNFKILMKKLLLTAFAILLAFSFAHPQTTKEQIFEDLNKSGGVYYAYPTVESCNTPAPKGYEPFYISHYGRHGSRYLISDNDYIWVRDLLKDADENNALTEIGKCVLNRLDTLIIKVEGFGGALSPLGVRQQRGIAERMFKAYPEVFNDESEISARSTIVPRCILSMDALCERLKEFNPKLKMTRESADKYMAYLNYHSPESNKFTAQDSWWREQYRKFDQLHTNPDRLIASLFSDEEFVEMNVHPYNLMWGLYWIAVDMQNVETKLSFYDIFEPQELFDLWQSVNYRTYVCDSNYPGSNGLLLDNAKPLLRNIIESAENVINCGGSGATFRFGHDGNLIPLTGILRLKGCYNSEAIPDKICDAFRTYEVAPMAGNVQIVFFRNKKNNRDVIVKFMLHEKEISIPVETNIYPFYNWNDVKSFYENILTD